jgi:hypothetical protein
MQPHFHYFVRKILRLKGDNFDDALQELTALAYDLYLSLVRRGKDIFYTPLMKFAIKRYREGRRFIGTNSVDAMSEQTKIKGRSKIGKEDALYFMADKKTNVAKSMQFKMDFSDWYHMQSPKDKDIIHDLIQGETPSDIARKHGQSPASITYRRQYYAKNWDNHIGGKWGGSVA